jgi:hypothetical protein
MRRLTRIAVLGFVAIACWPQRAAAAIITLDALPGLGTFTLSGSLAADNDIRLIPFTLLEDGVSFVAQTTSFGSGVGFDPYLALFDENGTIVQAPDPEGSPALFDLFNEDIDADTGNWDSRLALTLSAGSYTLLLGQAFNYYHDGQLLSFDFDDSADYTQAFAQAAGIDCGGGFVAFGGLCRTGAYGLNVELTAAQPPPAPVPEPATLTLFGLGAAGAALRNTYRRRRNRS